ncbi:ABC transporter substrate-binding protein [Metabacillus halosaccharovorans]|uniref:ABC transporter substrate-binding protein n=1 Tax=Metabacillus halosaccharovorans TaxID=930124 RepID=A0ABT3DBI7_9BACI|nr:ABC transporter substrate-binding protein [Metabacillus halosaccharovorans]MCV9884420.1 ABC transporter substrate-binding protein [Metabacillus halosaccharovorans]
MSKKHFLGFTALALVMTGLLVGCQSTSSEPMKKESDENTANYESLTFDNYGRDVEITEKPQNVLTLGPNSTELFVALGLTDYVIGNSLDNHSRGPLPEYESEYKKIPELTYGSATREAVTTSGADFIYGIDWEFGGEGLDVEELESFGIKTYMNSATTLEEIYQEIYDIGKIFEIEDVATDFVTDQKSRISAVQEKVSNQEPVNVLVYDSGGDGVFTAGGTNFETLLIELAGGKNVFDDITDKQWTTVSYEEVLARQPDVIVVHDYDAPSLEQKIKDIKNDPALSQLDSVKNERFISITLESVLPGDRMAYAVETLAKGFYPGKFE